MTVEEHVREMVQCLPILEALLEQDELQIRESVGRSRKTECGEWDSETYRARQKMRVSSTTYKALSDVSVSKGIHDESEDWSFNLKTFLATRDRCSLGFQNGRLLRKNK